jgi:hypothetical protein
MSCKNHDASAEGAKQTGPGVEAVQRPNPWVGNREQRALRGRNRFLLLPKNLCRPYRACSTLHFSWGLRPRLGCSALSALKA